MSVLVSLLTSVSLVLLSGTGRLMQADVELRIQLVSRQINTTNPTEQNNVVTLSCRSENTTLPGSSRPVQSPRYFVRNPLTGRSRKLIEISLDSLKQIKFTITPEQEVLSAATTLMARRDFEATR